MANPHLFDGRLAILYWTPRSVSETSIGQLADNLRAAAPNVNAVLIKTNNGAGWQGALDSSKPNLALNAVADVARWSSALAERGLECHAWGVARGLTPSLEADLIASLCRDGGVKSYLFDLELGSVYFNGDQDAARQLALGVRERVGPDFHLGLILDARGNKPANLWVQSVWFPEIDSLHPMVYHYHFGASAEQALRSCYLAVGAWGKPIYPMLQAYTPDGYAPYPAAEIATAGQVAVEQYRATGLSYFRYGFGLATSDAGAGAADLSALSQVSLPVSSPAPAPPPNDVVIGLPPLPPPEYPTLVIVDPDNERTGEFGIHYYGDPLSASAGWAAEVGLNGRTYVYRQAANHEQTLYVAYVPRLSARGRYALEAFIPGQHAYTPDVRYVVVDYPAGQRRETTVVLDQSPYYDVWAPLTGTAADGQAVSEYELDPAFADAGRVNAADVTFLDGQYEVTFGALRWRPVGLTPPPDVVSYDPPIGTPAERAGQFPIGGQYGEYPRWVGNWFDANPIGSRYWLGASWAIHTGADLNLTGGVLADKDAPVYSIFDGVVIWARRVSAGWKNIIIIEHPVPGEDRVVYARYAHVSNMRVTEGQRVYRGQQIAAVGEYAPNNYHLHFDISPGTILKTVPGHWPGDHPDLVRQHYIDPLEFIRQRHMVR